MRIFGNVFCCLLPLLWSEHVAAMFAKKQREYELKGCVPEARFRHNLAELFLDNTVSADRALSLLEDAHVAGAAHLKDLCKGPTRKNARLNLRKMLEETC